MKAWFIVVIGALVGGFFLFTAETPILEATTPPVPEQPDPFSWNTRRMIGTSMQQHGFEDGETFRLYPNRICEPGDFCSFRCRVDKCLGNYGASKGMGYWVKQLVSVDDDCYWFEGNPEPWEEGGILVQSFDSRTYGCLKSSEFVMEGIAIPDTK